MPHGGTRSRSAARDPRNPVVRVQRRTLGPAARSTTPHAVNAASIVAFTSVSSIGPMGGSAARSSSGPVSRSETTPGLRRRRDLVAVGGSGQHCGHRAATGFHEARVEHLAELIVVPDIIQHAGQRGLDHGGDEEVALKLPVLAADPRANYRCRGGIDPETAHQQRDNELAASLCPAVDRSAGGAGELGDAIDVHRRIAMRKQHRLSRIRDRGVQGGVAWATSKTLTCDHQNDSVDILTMHTVP